MRTFWLNYTIKDSYGRVTADGDIQGNSDKLTAEAMGKWKDAIASAARSNGVTAHSVRIDSVIELDAE